MAASKQPFQSTLPRGERQHHFTPVPAGLCFNPRSREGSDQTAIGHRRYRCVSIHAPARGATCVAARCFARRVQRFNPRSREGSDGANGNGRSRHYGFNPRSREGSDRKISRNRRTAFDVSIHAPARGATRSRFRTTYVVGFNPRSREGSDSIYTGISSSASTFQSTLPRGERLHCRRTISHFRKSFNPRSREGSDVAGHFTRCHSLGVSIHAPARGATHKSDYSIAIIFGFNPRSREGSDCDEGYDLPELIEFQSTLPRGERH